MTRLFTRWLISVLINAIALFVVSEMFSSFYIESFSVALFAGVIISIFNFTVKPILIIFTLPATVLTLGLFLFVINAIILMLTQSVIGESFTIDSFGIAIIASIIISVINVLLSKIIQSR